MTLAFSVVATFVLIAAGPLIHARWGALSGLSALALTAAAVFGLVGLLVINPPLDSGVAAAVLCARGVATWAVTEPTTARLLQLPAGPCAVVAALLFVSLPVAIAVLAVVIALGRATHRMADIRPA